MTSSTAFFADTTTTLLLSASAALALCSCAQGSRQLDATRTPPPYIAVNAKLPRAYPEASNRGSFLVVNDCVVFRRAGDGLLLTPIFPKDSRIVPTELGILAIFIGGSKVPLGKEVRLSGGYLDDPVGGDISLQRPVHSTCPTPFWLVGSIMNN